MNGEYMTIETAKQKAVYDRNLKQKIDYKNRIDKAIGYMKHYIEVEDAPINERIKVEFNEVIKLLKGDD